MAGKTGFLYVFDRVTGAPIWPIEERPVPRSEVPGEQSWPTQPYPTKPPPFSRQSFTADDINPHPIVTNEARDALRQRMTGSRNLGLFTPIGFVDTVHMPGANGGALFGYAAAAPSGQVYVIGQNDPGVLKLMRSPQTGAAASPGQTVYLRECQACHGPDRSGTATGPTLLDCGAGRRDQRSASDVRDRRPAVPACVSLGRHPGGRTAARRRGAEQSPQGIRRVRAPEEIRRLTERVKDYAVVVPDFDWTAA